MNPLYQAILDFPEDDVRRLVYADKIQEAGNEDYANFIRAQIAGDVVQGKLWHEAMPLVGQQHPWFEELPGLNPNVLSYEAWTNVCRIHTTVGNIRVHWFIERGFVNRVDCTMDAWLLMGKEAITHHPIQQVEIIDREPRTHPLCLNQYWWVSEQNGYISTIPRSVWVHPPISYVLTGKYVYPRIARIFNCVADAKKALSDACILRAKHEATKLQMGRSRTDIL